MSTDGDALMSYAARVGEPIRALSPLEAVVANGGTETAALYGWSEPYPDPDPGRAAEAEALTDALAAPAYDALSPGERETLLGQLEAAVVAAELTGDGAPDRIREAGRIVRDQ